MARSAYDLFAIVKQIVARAIHSSCQTKGLEKAYRLVFDPT